KAVQMHTFALDTKMRPNDKITRQEAFAVLARAFKLASTDVNNKALDKFGDKAAIASWALKDLNGMAEAGYIKGSPNGNLNPKANITRAEFAVVMDSLVKQYIDKAGTVTEVAASGNVMIRTAGVTLKGVTVKGDLIIGDGVGEGDAVLDSVKVEGRTVVRGGGINSIIIRGNSNVGSIIVSKTTGEVRVSVEGGADVEIIYVDDGSDDVIVQGSIGTLELASDNVTVTATEATIAKAIISGEKSAIVVEKGSAITTVTVSGANAAISGQGEVKTVSVVAGGNNTSITTPNTVTEVASDVSGVTAGGKEVPAGATATNNATGTDATVEEPAAGGGGGGGVATPVLSIAGVTFNSDPVSPLNGLYTIPNGATKENTAIDVTISNTANVDYSVVISIKNGNTEVAHANATGIEKVFIDALSKYDAVEFVDIARMFDRLGSSHEGWYLKEDGTEVPGYDQTAFEDAIDAMFKRMGDQDTYTVTVTLTPTGGTAGSLSFDIKKAS
ncbi:MAG: S-layer homology domain-containing protein, partial [Eubacteriales bacterium]|nr:S-layer homology domain-containing protein [Eubacteriales bacterium]